MRKIQKKLLRSQIRAFTMLESLLTLFVLSFLILAMSSTVKRGFEQVEEELFLLEFEHFYRESQRLSVTSQSKLDLHFSKEKISNGIEEIAVPRSVQSPENLVLQLDKAGGNSSLSKFRFETKDYTVTYQLYLGNGKFKKTKS